MTGTRAFGGAGPLDALAAIGGGGFGGIGTPQALVAHGLDERGAHDVLDRCVGLGVGIVDTAYGYAGGASHRMIGTWLAAAADRRGQIAIVGKVGVVARDGHWGVSNVPRVRRPSRPPPPCRHRRPRCLGERPGRVPGGPGAGLGAGPTRVQPVVGVSKPQHLDVLAAALDVQLDRGDVEAIAGRLM